MVYTVAELACKIAGTVEGDGSRQIYGVAGLQDAGTEEITFAVPPYLEYLHLVKAGAVVVPMDAQTPPGLVAIRVENPRSSFAMLSQLFNPLPERKQGIDAFAKVDESAQVDPTAVVMPFAYVGPKAKVGAGTILYPHTYVGDEAIIGAGCTLHPNSVVQEKCELGDRVILQPGAVIGADGFGFTLVDGAHKKVPQVGRVIIGNDVEIGANTTIDRGTLGDTLIGDGTKMDNLVHLGHNVQTGKHCLFVALTGISGSTTIGDYCTFGGQSATSGHLAIGDRCLFAGRSGITHDIPADSVMAGFPVIPHKEWLRQEVSLHKLPELLKKVRELEKKVK